MSQEDGQKSLEKILEEYFSNPDSSNKAFLDELISEEVLGEMKEAALSFDSLMEMQKRLTEIYHHLIQKKSSNKEISEDLQETK